MGAGFLSSAGAGSCCALSIWGCQTPAQYWIKSCTHASRNSIQYWGWALEEGSWSFAGKKVSSENAQNIALGIFWFVGDCWFLKLPVRTLLKMTRILLKVLMTFGDFWVFLGGHRRKKNKKNSFFSGGVHSWVFGCLVRMGKTQLWAIWLWYILKGANFQKIVCVSAKNTIFPICGQEWQNFHFAPISGCGPKFWTKMFFFGGGHVGLVFLFFCIFGPPHLALNPPYFCWLVLVFLSFLVWFVFFRIGQNLCSLYKWVCWRIFSVPPFLSP